MVKRHHSSRRDRASRVARERRSLGGGRECECECAHFVCTYASHARSPETLSGVGHAFLRFFFYLVLVGYNVRDMYL